MFKYFPCPLQALVEELRRLLDKYLDKILSFKNKNCSELVPAAELNVVASLARLFDALGTVENGVRCYIYTESSARKNI